MKMAAVSAISLLLLCCFTLFSAGSKVCSHFAATGDNFTVTLDHKLVNSERLTWKHNDVTIIDRRKDNKIITGNREYLDEKGSLKLKNLNKNHSGLYTPEVFDTNGRKLSKLNAINLCVLDRVPKPTVTMDCPKPNDVRFICRVQTQVKDLQYEWLQNNNVMDKNKYSKNTLTQVAKAVEKDSFTCNASNKVSSMVSEAVVQTCFKPDPIFPEKLFGINTWIFVGAGGGIVVVLIIVVIVCCIRTKRRKRMQLKEEGELPLAWTNEQHHQHSHPPDQHQRQHHHHHHHHHQQQPAGHTGPRQHRSKQHRDQQRPRAPDHHGGHPQPGGQPQPSPRRPAHVGDCSGSVKENSTSYVDISAASDLYFSLSFRPPPGQWITLMTSSLLLFLSPGRKLRKHQECDTMLQKRMSFEMFSLFSFITYFYCRKNYFMYICKQFFVISFFMYLCCELMNKRRKKTPASHTYN
ncbi:hypothetical protein ABVT39_010238 [Epinephelus coioides]